jgi:hypothetical protein
MSLLRTALISSPSSSGKRLTVIQGAGSSRGRVVAATAFGLALATGAGLSLWVVVESYSPVPFADFWGQFPFIERAVGGDLRLGDLWAQSNEHRIFVPRIAFAIEYAFFGGRYIFLLTLLGASLLALAGIMALVVRSETRDPLLAWATFCVAVIALLSPTAEENLTWPFQIGFVEVFLFAATAVYAAVLAHRLPARRRWSFMVVAALAAVAATYSLANGLLVWLVLLLLAVGLELGSRAIAFLALIGALTTLSYVWHFEPVEGHARYGDSLVHPAGLAKYALVFLGSVVRPSGVYAAGFAGAIGVALFVLLALVAWTGRGQPGVATPVGFGLALFALLSAVETAVGRLNLGLTQALSPRYATPSAVFWLGLLLGFLRPALDRVKLSLWLGGRELGIEPWVYLLPAALIALGLSLAALPDRVSVRQPVIGKELVVLAYRAGVEDPARTEAGSSPQLVRSGLGWLRRERLGPWAPGGMVDGARFTLPHPLRPTPRCPGDVDAATAVGAGTRLEGWLVPPSGEDASDQVAVVDANGVTHGFGLVGTYRRDVLVSGAATSEWTGFVAYLRGPATAPLRVVLLGTDRRSAVCALDVPEQG